MLDIEIEGLQELIDEAMEMEASIRRVTLQQIENLGQFARHLCKIELEDVRYTGRLESSFIVSTNQADLKAEIYPTAPHRMFVRMGTRPHWAPIGPLKAWARAKLGDESAAYPVQRSIAEHGTSMYQLRKRGTKANPWPQRVVARSDFQAARRRTAQAAGKKILAEFG